MGSFFNVCIYRIPRGMPLSYPGSHCYRCGRPIHWYDNIPLLSYWILGGRCRQCGASFSIRYFIVELLTALLFLLGYSRIGPGLALIPGYLFISLLIIATFTDIDHWIIPDRISIGGLGLGLLLALVWPLGLAPHNPLAEHNLLLDLLFDHVGYPPRAALPAINAFAGAAVGLLSMWGIGSIGSLIFRKEAMGWGDIKLFAMFGAFCGPASLLYILVFACFFGTIAGGIGLWLGRRAARQKADPAIAPLESNPKLAEALIQEHPLGGEERRAVLRALTKPGALGPVRHHLPFGPSLALAAVAVYLYGEVIGRWFASLTDRGM